MAQSTPFICILIALGAVGCQADLNITDYVFWTKDGIYQWHQFFPTRSLEEESNTIVIAQKSLPSNISEDLKKILTFQYNELQTAKQLMEGTDAEGCINGISNFLDQAVADQQESYEDCIADAPSKLTRFYNSWARTNSSYQASYQRALAGIDSCAKTYPNKDSVGRLRSCVESMNNAYFTAANNTQISLFPSPTMSYFKDSVVQCASSAAESIASKGSQFLKMLVNCASLSGTIDPEEYSYELSQWKGYNDTLASQFLESQKTYSVGVSFVESYMLNYFSVRKQVLENYVIESRGYSFYLSKIYSGLSAYYNTLTATYLDNPGDSQCVDSAKTTLDSVANTGASESLDCDKAIVVDTKSLMSNIYDNFVYTNTLLPTVGNVALLNCYSLGYIFAPNTVLDCFKLKASGFVVEYEDRAGKNSDILSQLNKFENTFYSSTELPCGGTSVKRLFLGAESTLYDLQRCLYGSSGTTYEVTTPVPITTTTPTTSNSTAFS